MFYNIVLKHAAPPLSLFLLAHLSLFSFYRADFMLYFDSSAFKKSYADLYKTFTKQVASRRFSISV